jgi:hypothetical protein
MSHLNRYAIFALLDSGSASSIRSKQRRLTEITGNKMAFMFPVHITLKGRYIAQEDVISEAFQEINLTAIEVPVDICLSEPQYIKPELAWLEVLPQYQGYKTLLCLHKLFENLLSQVVIEDEVPEAYKNSGFRPHVTLGWGVTPEAWARYFSNAHIPVLHPSRIGSIALVRYPDSWPREGDIDVVFKIPWQGN